MQFSLRYLLISSFISLLVGGFLGFLIYVWLPKCTPKSPSENEAHARIDAYNDIYGSDTRYFYNAEKTDSCRMPRYFTIPVCDLRGILFEKHIYENDSIYASFAVNKKSHDPLATELLLHTKRPKPNGDVGIGEGEEEFYDFTHSCPEQCDEEND